MSTEYETDILDWSERQAALLRRLSAGERVNEGIDWENVIEEIESVGRSELKAVQSHIVLALLDDLRIRAWPQVRAVEYWRDEGLSHLVNARQHFEPGMRSRIDLGKLYREALRSMPETIEGKPPLSVPEVCPVSLEEMLAEES